MGDRQETRDIEKRNRTLLIVTRRLNWVRPGVKPMAGGGGYQGWLVQMHLLGGRHPTVWCSCPPPSLQCTHYPDLCLIGVISQAGIVGREEEGLSKVTCANATSQRSREPPLFSVNAFLVLHTVSCLLAHHTVQDGTLLFLLKTCTRNVKILCHLTVWNHV